MNTRHITRWFTAILFAFLLCACQNKQEKKHIKIAYVNWQESIAMSHVAQEILSSQGYDVELVYNDVSVTFHSLANKKVDIFMNVWLPYSNKSYIERYSKQLTKINTNYVNARIGLVVPEYTPIYSIKQLAEQDSTFKTKIFGIEKDSGIMKAAVSAIKSYNLQSYQLVYSDESTMIDSLEQALQRKEPVIITGWTPHWMFARYELRFLDDPHVSFGESQQIDTYSWKGFIKRNPYATSFFSRIQLNDRTMANLLDTFNKIEDPKEAARVWVEHHHIITDNWLPHE